MLLDLQLFAEEAGAPAVSAPATPAAENPGTGATGEPAASAGEQAAPAEGSPSFDDLIKGQYKKEFGQKVQEAVNKRFRNQQDFKDKFEKLTPLLSVLGQRYGVGQNAEGELDLDALQQQIANDNSLYEEEAFQRGMKVEDLRELKRLEYENAQLRRRQEMSAEEARNQAAFQQLVEAGEQLKAIYPDFDLGEEMGNPEFGRLIAVDIPLRTAYEIVHRDEIMEGSMRYAVQQTEKKLAKSIQAGARRPAENGSSGQGAADSGRIDPSKLTRQEIARIRKAAERGERITFGH